MKSTESKPEYPEAVLVVGSLWLVSGALALSRPEGLWERSLSPDFPALLSKGNLPPRVGARARWADGAELAVFRHARDAMHYLHRGPLKPLSPRQAEVLRGMLADGPGTLVSRTHGPSLLVRRNLVLRGLLTAVGDSWEVTWRGLQFGIAFWQ